MNYEALETTILQLVAEASEESLRVFGAETFVRLTQKYLQLDLIPKGDLDDEAWLALASACQHVLTASPTGATQTPGANR